MSATLAPGDVHDLREGRRHLTRFALLCLWTALGAGVLGSLLYTPLHPALGACGLTLRSLRPLHLAAGVGWIYLAGLAVVVHHWARTTGDTAQRAQRTRALRFFLATWVLGALVVAITLLLGRYGGREYFFVSVPASALFWLGWVAMAWAFVRGLPRSSGAGASGASGPSGAPGKAPVYVWMWLTSFGLFTYAFVETHVFLLPYFQRHPLRDMAVEWKSYGTLVGSFNLLVYGSLAYLGERLNPKADYARSRMAFGLFWVGILNSFTNYGHHTYHLPQSSVVKWTSFIISMTEVVILAKVVWDVRGWARWLQVRTRSDGAAQTGARPNGVSGLLLATTVWTLASMVISIAISVPPLNALIHGTFVVAAHAMGSMLGIDTMALLAVLAWLNTRDHGREAPWARGAVLTLNAGVLVLWSTFMIIGVDDSARRWQSGVLPSASLWPAWFGTAFLGGGLLVAAGVVWLTRPWLLTPRQAPVAPPA